MIIGTGTDIVEIKRIEKALENKRFLDEYFGGDEKEFLLKKKNSAPSIANNFAAKEAFSKALGTGVRGFSVNEVQTLRDELGKPYIILLGNAKKAADKLGVKNIFVSLSNTEQYALAYVILEG